MLYYVCRSSCSKVKCFRHINSIYVASLQKSRLVGSNESGIIPDLSKKYFLNLNLSLFCLLISMIINIIFYVSMAVLSNKNMFKCYYL